MTLSIIVGMTKDRLIGKGGSLPWHIPEDMKHFKETTMGHAIIMGRKTHESIGRALPGRRNIVVTSRSIATPGVETARTLDEAVALAPDGWVIGGAELYRAALPLAKKLVITWIHRDASGDTYFPEIDFAEWKEVSRKGGDGIDLVTYMRA